MGCSILTLFSVKLLAEIVIGALVALSFLFSIFTLAQRRQMYFPSRTSTTKGECVTDGSGTAGVKLSEAWTYSMCCWVQTCAPYEGPLIPVVRLSEGLGSSTGQSGRPTGMAGSCIRSISFQIWLFLVSMLVFGGVFPPGFFEQNMPWKFLKGKTDPRFGHPTGKDSHGVREPMALGWDLIFFLLPQVPFIYG